MTREAGAAAVLSIGDELLAGAHPDLNSPLLATLLSDAGWSVRRVEIVADGEAEIADAVTRLARDHALVAVSGGLGPTLDDVTRHGVARAAGVELVHSEVAWSQITAWYRAAGREMPESNRRQALVPRSGEVLLNRRGTAPGFRCTVAGSQLFVFPGPPSELKPMAEEHLKNWMDDNPVDVLVTSIRYFHLFDISESVFADRARAWMARSENPLMGVTVKGGVLTVKLLARCSDSAQAEALLEQRGAEVLEEFGEHVFSETSADLASVLAEELFAGAVSVTTAESCTGGMVAAALTRVPGVSALFSEGVVVYSNAAKRERLGVDVDLLERHGAVSAEVAEAMASGAAAATGARLALATTGIAGPGGGSEEKPVGLVWFGVSLDGRVSSVSRRWPAAGREKIRQWATAKALSLGLEALRRSPAE